MPDLDFIKTNATEIYNEIITELEHGVSEPLFPGDERRIFGEALVPIIIAMYAAVNDAARQKMLRYARGTVLDALAENRGITRQLAKQASTVIRFSVANTLSRNVLIPAGTRITGDSARYFETTRTAVIIAGSLHIEVEAKSMEGGSEFNDIPVGDIVTLVDLSNAPLVSAVSNTTATSGGADEESDDSLRERIRNAPNSMSTAGPISAYRYWALAADPLISDAYIHSPSPGVVMVTPIMFGGEVPGEELLGKVLASVAAPDRRPLTDHVKVQAPTEEYYDIELTYFVSRENASGAIETIEGADGAIARYNMWQSSQLNIDINPDRLRRLILAPDWTAGLTAADRVNIVKPEFTELDPSKVAKFSGNLKVDHVVV
jgi:phage-related baseplate assembly protein